MVGEAKEEDAEFYGSSVWQEDADDSEYSTEPEQRDKFDSDFDASEDSSDDEAAADREREAKRQSRPKRKVPKTVVRPKVARPKPRSDLKRAAPAAPVPSSRSLRHSTKTKTLESAQEQKKELKRLRDARRRLPVKAVLQLSQEELLLEACQTEEENYKWLQVQQRKAREREVNQQVIKKQVLFQERRLSRKQAGMDLIITFPMNEHFPKIFDSSIQDDERQRMAAPRACAVTGLPAKYLDPLTHQPYATLEAFKEIRRRAGVPADARHLPKDRTAGRKRSATPTRPRESSMHLDAADGRYIHVDDGDDDSYGSAYSSPIEEAFD